MFCDEIPHYAPFGKTVEYKNNKERRNIIKKEKSGIILT